MATLSIDGQAPSVRNAGLQSGAREPDSKSNNTKSSLSNPFNLPTDKSGSAMTGRVSAELGRVNGGAACKKPTVYNAWDNNGQQHTRFRTQVSSGATPATAQMSSEKPPVRRGRWAKVVSSGTERA
jgi:hypothetical protein